MLGTRHREGIWRLERDTFKHSVYRGCTHPVECHRQQCEWYGLAIVLTYPAERGGNFSSKYIHSITFIQYIHLLPLAEVAYSTASQRTTI
jgi:hypothetical protein